MVTLNYVKGFDDLTDEEKLNIEALVLAHIKAESSTTKAKVLQASEVVEVYNFSDAITVAGDAMPDIANTRAGLQFNYKPWRTKLKRARLGSDELAAILDLMGLEAALEEVGKPKPRKKKA